MGKNNVYKVRNRKSHDLLRLDPPTGLRKLTCTFENSQWEKKQINKAKNHNCGVLQFLGRVKLKILALLK